LSYTSQKTPCFLLFSEIITHCSENHKSHVLYEPCAENGKCAVVVNVKTILL